MEGVYAAGMPIARPARSGVGRAMWARRELGDPREDLRPRGACPAFGGVDVNEHLLRRGQQDLIAGAPELVEQMKALVIEAEHLGRYVQVLARGRLRSSDSRVSTV